MCPRSAAGGSGACTAAASSGTDARVIVTGRGFSAVTCGRCFLRATLTDRWCVGVDERTVRCTVCVVAGDVDGPPALTGATRVVDTGWRRADSFFVVVAGAGGWYGSGGGASTEVVVGGRGGSSATAGPASHSAPATKTTVVGTAAPRAVRSRRSNDLRVGPRKAPLPVTIATTLDATRVAPEFQ